MRKNTSGTTGVHWCKNANKWNAQIKVDGLSRNLGLFAQIGDAINARREALTRFGFHRNHGLELG